MILSTSLIYVLNHTSFHGLYFGDSQWISFSKDKRRVLTKLMLGLELSDVGLNPHRLTRKLILSLPLPGYVLEILVCQK